MIEEEIIAAEDEPKPPQDLAADALLPAVVRSEVNFLRLPFFSLQRRDSKKKVEMLYEFTDVRNGKKVTFTWLVIPSTKYGCPTAFDRRVARAIDALIDEAFVRDGYQLVNPISFSIYHLAELMERKSRKGGWFYEDIRTALKRMVATTVESQGSFFLKDEEVWVEKVFHPYEEVLFVGMRMSDGSIAETNYLWLHELYLRNINARYVRPLDYQFLRNLKNDIAGRLYEVLSAKFYGLEDGVAYYHVDYQEFCKTLPISPQRYYSATKRQLKPAHNELGRWSFLSKVAYVLHDGNKEVKTIRYYPGERAKREMSGELLRRAKSLHHVEEQILLPLDTETKKETTHLTGLAKELYERGISEKVVMRICQKYPEERVREKIEMFDFLKSKQDMDNPAGWLRQAIEEDWKPTEAQKKAKAKAELLGAREKRAQLNREKEEIAASYSEKAEAILFEMMEREKEAVEKAVLSLLAEKPSLLQWYDESKPLTEQRAMVQATVRIHLREKFPDAFLAITAERDEKMSEISQQITALQE